MDKLSSLIQNEPSDDRSKESDHYIKYHLNIKNSIRNIVDKFFEKPTDINIVNEVTESIFELLDTLSQENLSISPPVSPLACNSGCSYCCMMRVLLTPLEIYLIVNYIESNFSNSKISNLISKLYEVDDVTHGLTEEEHGNAHVSCPLLVDNKCSVYEVRPLECRGYSSMDVKACKSAMESYSQWNVPIYQEQYLLFKSAHAGIIESLLIKQNKFQLLELTSALKIVFSTENIFDRWMSGDQVFISAEIDDSDPEKNAFLPWTPTLDC